MRTDLKAFGVRMLSRGWPERWIDEPAPGGRIFTWDLCWHVGDTYAQLLLLPITHCRDVCGSFLGYRSLEAAVRACMSMRVPPFSTLA